jgi:hypothetical protein
MLLLSCELRHEGDSMHVVARVWTSRVSAQPKEGTLARPPSSRASITASRGTLAVPPAITGSFTTGARLRCL